MSVGQPAQVILVDVDEDVLDELVRVATSDASANEVTPPLTAGEAWTEARVAWFLNYHRDRRAGLDGPKAEATWAVLTSDGVIGSVRLKRTDTAGILETGIWLARRGRSQGIGTAAAAATIRLAKSLGASAVRADTTAANVEALAVLKRLGFRASPADSSGSVQALVELGGTAAP